MAAVKVLLSDTLFLGFQYILCISHTPTFSHNITKNPLLSGHLNDGREHVIKPLLTMSTETMPCLI